MKNIYSLAAHLKLHHNSTTSNTYLHSYMTLKVLDQLKPIGAKKIFTKPNCNLCIEELLMIKKAILQTRHSYEQDFGDIQGLPEN